MTDKNDTPIDKDKDTLMEVRGIIDGCIESGSKEYAKALQEIVDRVSLYRYNTIVFPPSCKVPDGLTASL